MEETTSTPSSASATKSKRVKGESIFAVMPPQFAFWAGIITSTAIIAVIGFIVMLVIVLNGGLKASGTTTAPTAVANTNAAGSGTTLPTGTIEKKDLRNVRGKGKLTIVEFSDLDCSFCKTIHPTLVQIQKDYEGKVAWAFNHFPLNIHPGAQLAAEASECAAAQNKFWEFTDAHFNSGKTNEQIADHVADAVALGLDKAKFEKCLADGTTKDVITSDSDLAQKLGAQGTPYGLIIDEKGKIVGSIPGALPAAQIKTILDGLLK